MHVEFKHVAAVIQSIVQLLRLSQRRCPHLRPHIANNVHEQLTNEPTIPLNQPLTSQIDHSTSSDYICYKLNTNIHLKDFQTNKQQTKQQ